MKEITKIYGSMVIGLCIKENWYTHGTNKEYTRMLDMCKGLCGDVEYTIELLEEIAKDIYEHTDKEKFYGADDDEAVASIMFELRREACVTYYTK